MCFSYVYYPGESAMKFKFDGKALKTVKKELSTHFVVNSITSYAVSGHPNETAAKENAADRNERAIAMKVDVRYSVEVLADGEAVESIV